jgi:anhydro-N-acetylmuramic acid kinase
MTKPESHHKCDVKTGLYIGLMSGTSMDGVDVALVNLQTHTCIAGLTRPYGQMAKDFLKNLLNGNMPIRLETLSELNQVLGKEFGLAVLDLLKMADCPGEAIVAIGSHGQTICHDATAKTPYTVQLACPHTIAEMTGIQVIADFRTRDIVVGGSGAPFAPLYHQVLFAKRAKPLVVVNIGGIANVSFLEDEAPPKGFDTGPGNCLMDAWIQAHLHKPFDKAGAWASRGRVIEPLLSRLLADPYFCQKPPKSIGKEYFSLNWLYAHLDVDETPVDVQATLLELTALTISQGVKCSNLHPSTVVLCGGGVHNQMLYETIQQHLGDLSVVSSERYGAHPDFIEAMMFAWLAEQTILQNPLDLSALTGARKPVILGAIYPV